jgi:hypothetical protein
MGQWRSRCVRDPPWQSTPGLASNSLRIHTGNEAVGSVRLTVDHIQPSPAVPPLQMLPSCGNGSTAASILDQSFRILAAVSPNIILRCRELNSSSSTTSTGRL